MTHSSWHTVYHVGSGKPPIEAQSVGSVVHIDPAKVRVNRWHGRLGSRFESAHFQSMKRDIAASGGNVVPALGRVLAGSSSVELVYGSLRAQACRELGLPILTVIQDLQEHEVFPTMIREGALRWSLFELGTSVVRALEGGLFPSHRKLAEACGLKLQVTRAAAEAARLPTFVVQAFGSPSRLTSSMVSRLAGALQADPEGVERRAQTLLGEPASSSKKVMAALTNT